MRITNTMNTQKSPSFGSYADHSRKIITGNLSKFAKSIEFNSMNMSFPMLLAVMVAGVLVPRIALAQDNFDREEILRRDSVTITTIAFGAPILSKLFSKACEKKSGFVLTDKPKQTKTVNKILDYLRPIKGVHVLSSGELVSKYSEIEKYDEKNIHNAVSKFCEFVDKEGGNLKKILTTKKETKELVSELCGGEEAFAKAENKTIIDALKNASEKNLKKLCSHFSANDNAFVKKAKTLNSTFGFISMILLVPLLLGIILPKMNEKITKQKIANRQKPDMNSKQAEDNQIYKSPYFMASSKNGKTVFNNFNKENQ